MLALSQVHFDIPPEECIRRIEARVGHPTLPPHRGRKAVTSFADSMQPPNAAEGFERVHVVRSFADADALLAALGASSVAAGGGGEQLLLGSGGQYRLVAVENNTS